jgi:G3E family GTPase
MKLLIIAGFLGSGKTTLLLEIAQRLAAASQKIAIVENEMGEVGVDGDYLTLEGLHVQELLGGCICCTLAAGLVPTLEKVRRLVQPDLVILEATGAARPADITQNLHDYRAEVDSIQTVTLVDASRFEILMEVVTPLVTAQIEGADVVVVNKIDQVDQDTLGRTIDSATALNPRARVVAISAEAGTQLTSLMAELRC